MKPIIFLDFDGVLNQGCGKLETRLVQRVAKVVEATDAQVVLSTTWREHHPFIELRQLLHERGLSRARVIGRTPILRGRTRGQEIAQWLRERQQPIRFAVLDDNDAGPFDMHPVRRHLIRTHTERGFTRTDRERTHQMLMDGPQWSEEIVL